MQKQYDISVWLPGKPRYFYYLHFILIQKQYDINRSLLCNPRDFYYLHDILIDNQYDFMCQTTNLPIRAWNIYESSPFSRKKFLSLCSIVTTTE